VPNQNKGFKEILSRITEGLNESARFINEGLIKTRKNYQNLAKDNAFILSQLQT
jgi:hypothetical protein